MVKHPSSIHGYEIQEVIGRGGFAVVYRALAPDGRAVALKVLHANSSERLKRRFGRGAHSQAMLEHDGIVRIRESFEDAIAMDCVSDIDLKKEIQRLRVMRRRLRTNSTDVLLRAETALTAVCEAGIAQSRLPELDPSYVDQVARWGFQIADALATAHDNGIVHRDIKPSNLLLDDQGNVVVTDFDLAFQIDADEALTLTGDSACTVDYCSPEQALRRPAHEFSTDIYSLGVVLFELLCLRLPFERWGEEANDISQTQDATIQAPRADRFALGVPKVLADIVERALRKDPADRYPHAREMARDLELFLRKESLRVCRPSPITMLTRTLARHRALWSAAIAVTLIALVLATSAWVLAGIRQLDRLDVASRSGDLETVIAEIERIGFPFTLFLDEALLPLQQDTEHPARRVQRELHMNLDGGLMLAAAYLREDGPTKHPLLVRFFESRVADNDDSAQRKILRNKSLLWAGRALLEAPCNSRAMMHAYDGIRSRCWVILEASSKMTVDTLWALAIVSASGSAQDGIRIVDWLGKRPFILEEARMGISALRQIMQRLWSCRDSAGENRKLVADAGIGLRKKLALLLHEWLRNEKLTMRADEVIRGSWANFIQAAAINALRCKATFAFGRWRDLGRQSRRITFLEGVFDNSQSELKSAQEVPEFISYLLYHWGWKLAILGKALDDAAIPNLGRQSLVTAMQAKDERTRLQILKAFEEGIDDGRAPWKGRIPTQLDRESLLRYSHAQLPAAEIVRCDSLSNSLEQVKRSSVASWSFRGGRPVKSGAAGDPRTESASLREYSSMSHIRLGSSGMSAVHLPFKLTKHLMNGVMLDIWHIAATRDQFPFEGEVMIDILLDRVLIEPKRVIHGHEDNEPDSFRICDRLEPGPHVLTFRLSANTTTTYWLMGARIREAEIKWHDPGPTTIRNGNRWMISIADWKKLSKSYADLFSARYSSNVTVQLPDQNQTGRDGSVQAIMLRAVPRALASFGVQVGDMLLEINGEPVVDLATATLLLQRQYEYGIRRFELAFLRKRRVIFHIYLTKD